MYYGGGQKRPDAQYSRPIKNSDGQVIGHVGEGNRKDVRNAVEAAHKAAPGYVTGIEKWWMGQEDGSLNHGNYRGMVVGAGR
jgi:hypothetical protein